MIWQSIFFCVFKLSPFPNYSSHSNCPCFLFYFSPEKVNKIAKYCIACFIFSQSRPLLCAPLFTWIFIWLNCPEQSTPTEAHFSCNIVLMHSALVLYHHLFCKPAMPHFSMVIPENNSCIWISRMPDLIINTISLHHHAVAAMSWSLRLVLHGSA